MNAPRFLLAAVLAPALCAPALLSLPSGEAQAKFKFKKPKLGDLGGGLEDITGRKSKDAGRTDDRARSRGSLTESVIYGVRGDRGDKANAAASLAAAAYYANRAKIRPNTAANGALIGLGQLQWGMTAAQLRSTRLGGVAAREVATKLDGYKSFEFSPLRLFRSSGRRYVAQAWLRGDQLCQFEMRPTDDRDAPGARAEMMAYCIAVWPQWNAKARELKTDRLEQSYTYQVPTGTRQTVVGTQEVWVGNQAVTNSSGGVSYVPMTQSRPVFGTVTDYETRTGVDTRLLGFTVTQDDWQLKNGVAYRLALLSGQGGGGMSVARLQGRREGGVFPFVIAKNYRLSNAKGIAGDIRVNYNVSPHTFR